MLSPWTPLFWTKAHALCAWPHLVARSELERLVVHSVAHLVPHHSIPCHPRRAVLQLLVLPMSCTRSLMLAQTCVPCSHVPQQATPSTAHSALTSDIALSPDHFTICCQTCLVSGALGCAIRYDILPVNAHSMEYVYMAIDQLHTACVPLGYHSPFCRSF